ncbi:MAG: SLC13 family permease [Bacillota bacterium]
MIWEQILVLAVLSAMVGMFIWGKLRYDLVALLGLIVAAAAGLVQPQDAFAGFGHPAVVTVAAVLVISRGLLNSGIVDNLAGLVSRAGESVPMQVAVLTTLVAVSSAFINNVGALALFMPVTLRLARQFDTPVSALLMPLAFGSLLGGLTSLIGTPPNIIIATFRAELGAAQFRMFDFTPVGGAVAICGLVFLVLVGWRLIPNRRSSAAVDNLFEISEYITEVKIPTDSVLADTRLSEMREVTGADVTVVSIIRGEQTLPAPSARHSLRADDALIVRADAEDLQNFIDAAGVVLVGREDLQAEELGAGEITLIEAVITPSSPLEGRTASSLRLRSRYGVNLLAVSREGARLRARLADIRFRAGDVLLLQGREDAVGGVLQDLKCLPLAGRGLRMGQPRRLLIAGGIFAGALLLAALGVTEVQLALTAGAGAMVLAGFLSTREAYQSIDWSVIVLLACMIPISTALEDTGVASLAADQLLAVAQWTQPWVSLTLILLGVMLLSDVVNNAAATLLMAPIAVGVAQSLGASPDPFLMAVAVGASCAFLTPIGHQSNTLVMGPGGYHFGDYWKVGLPLEVVIAVVAIPMILWIWPLGI